MKRFFSWIWAKTVDFFKWIWRECRNWQTVLLLAVVCIVVGSPVWICGLLWFLFHWEWAFIVAAALLAFWWLPGMPYFAVCVSITLVIKKFLERRKKKKSAAQQTAAEKPSPTEEPPSKDEPPPKEGTPPKEDSSSEG